MISILFVDDEPALLDVGKIFLEENEGYSVQCALSGKEAINLMAATKFDAIVADYQMPGMDGITLLKKVREANKTLPYILFTGRGREEVAIEAMNEGADFYLQKGGSARVQYAELSHKIRIAVERRVAEAAFKESEERLRTIVGSIQVGIVTMDAKTHTILDVNPKAIEMIGAAKDEIVGNVCHRFICPAQAGSCPVTDLGQAADLSERVLLNKKGERISILKSVKPVTLAGKEVLIETFFDITDRKLSEQALQQVIRKLTLLSGITRHEINNQLIAVDGYLSIIEKKLKEPTLDVYFQKTMLAVGRISAMIAFAKEYEKIGINAPIWQDCRTLIETAGQQAPLGQIVLRNKLPDRAEIFADPLISLVIYNLMDNAVRYGGKITTIQVSSENQNGDRILIFDDDGAGVPVEEKEKIFEYGYGKNTGMGLFLAREILGLTGITIRESGEPGRGARFEVRVPEGKWRGEVTEITGN
jgi:PAS domain S-box-containing protein